MLDHVGLDVTDYARSREFYDAERSVNRWAFSLLMDPSRLVPDGFGRDSVNAVVLDHRPARAHDRERAVASAIGADRATPWMPVRTVARARGRRRNPIRRPVPG